MRNYEIIVILVHEATEDRQKELLKRIDSIFTKTGALVHAVHDRGKRTLGYKMKKHKEGHYYIYDIEQDPAKTADLIRELRLEDELLQVMISHPIEKKEASVGR